MASNFGERLKELRTSKKISQEELGKIVNTTKQTISNYETGKRNADYEMLEALADTFNVDIDYLLGKTDKTTIFPSNISNLIYLNKARKIPILGTIACGSPTWAEENYEGYFIADSTIKADFALKCKGDSMIEAEIYDGDLVFLKKTSDVENGKIAAVLIGNEATLKKVVKADNIVILQPCNSDTNTYKPILLDGSKDSMILGEMVGVYHPCDK